MGEGKDLLRIWGKLEGESDHPMMESHRSFKFGWRKESQGATVFNEVNDKGGVSWQGGFPR